jgi:hypothetical protein
MWPAQPSAGQDIQDNYPRTRRRRDQDAPLPERRQHTRHLEFEPLAGLL